MTTPIANSPTLSNLVSSLGIGQQSNSTPQSGDQLDMNAFLTLMTEQMKNQDPTKPLDSSQYLGQLAQFANLQGVQQLNGSMQGIASLLGQQQAVQVANLVGHTAYIKTDTAQISSDDPTVKGKVTTTTTGPVVINVKDAKGNVVRSFTVNAAGAGDTDFAWDGTDNQGQALPAGSYTFSATQGSASADIQIGARIDSVSFGAQGITLNLDGHNGVTFDQILSIG